MSSQTRFDAADDSDEKDSPAEVLVALATEHEDARQAYEAAEPESAEAAELSGYERGLANALEAFEDLREFEQVSHLPEWSVALENADGEWEWYYPHAVTRERAVEKARKKARADLGDGPLNVYEVGGPVAR